MMDMLLEICVVHDNKTFLENLYNTWKESSDSGVDLYCPEDLTIHPGTTTFIDLGIQCAGFWYRGCRSCGGKRIPTAYYVYPRSSLSKTPLRLANSVGIIDQGYRGNILAAVDNNGPNLYQIKKGQRLFQICSPDLTPMLVKIVQELDKTERGSGGFGSTGQ